jgi:hypothetical protein
MDAPICQAVGWWQQICPDQDLASHPEASPFAKPIFDAWR